MVVLFMMTSNGSFVYYYIQSVLYTGVLFFAEIGKTKTNSACFAALNVCFVVFCCCCLGSFCFVFVLFLFLLPSIILL